MVWLWILIGLNISELKGYSGGNFPEACDSMLPRHENSRGFYPPQSSPPPFEIIREHGKKIKDPITVILKSKDSRGFRGFMLEARNKNLGGDGPPVGRFITLDSQMTRLLKCNNLPDSAVSQRLNWHKSEFRVNWTAQGEDLDVIFRATFLQEYHLFWEKVTSSTPTSTSAPSTTEPTTAATTTESTESTTTTESTESTTTTESTESTTTTESTESTTTTESTESTTTTESTESTTTTESIESTTTTESATESTEPNNITSLSNKFRYSKTLSTLLMLFDSNLEHVKMEISNNILVLFAGGPIYYKQSKVLMIVCSTLCFLSSVCSLFSFIIDDSFNVTYLYVALVSVVTMINFLEWMFAILPLGYNHDLTDIFDLVLRVCFIVHHIFTTVLIFFGVLSLTDESERTRRESWLLIVLVAYTAWILLVIVWNVALTAYKKILQSNRTGDSQGVQGNEPQRTEKDAVQLLTVVSVILLVGTTAFSVAVSAGLFIIQKNQT